MEILIYQDEILGMEEFISGFLQSHILPYKIILSSQVIDFLSLSWLINSKGAIIWKSSSTSSLSDQWGVNVASL